MVRAWGLRETGKPLSGARGGGPGIFLPLHWRGSPSTNLKGALRSPGGPAPQAGVETGGHSPAENWPGPPRAGGQGVRALPRPQGTQDPDLMGSTWWRGFLLEGHLHQKGFRAWTWLQNQVGGWRGGQPSGERRHISTLGTPPWDPESQDIPREVQGALPGLRASRGKRGACLEEEVGGLGGHGEHTSGTADHTETGQTASHWPRGLWRCATQEAPRTEQQSPRGGPETWGKQQSPQGGPEARGKLAPCTVPWLTVWFPAGLSPRPGRSAQEACSQPRCPQRM